MNKSKLLGCLIASLLFVAGAASADAYQCNKVAPVANLSEVQGGNRAIITTMTDTVTTIVETYDKVTVAKPNEDKILTFPAMDITDLGHASRSGKYVLLRYPDAGGFSFSLLVVKDGAPYPFELKDIESIFYMLDCKVIGITV